MVTTPLATTLPQRLLPVLEGNNFTLPWYRKLQELQNAQSSAVDPAIIAQIEAEIAAIETTIAAIEAEIAALGTGVEPLAFSLIGAFDAGTVTEVDTGTGLTGGPITTTGTIKFASIADGDVLANISGGSAAPTANTVTAVLDHVFSNAEGALLYRGASAWSALAAGNSGYTLTAAGTGADPSWKSNGAVNFGVASGATGTSVTLPALASHAGGITGVSVQVVASDTMAFTFDIKKNGTSIFTSPRSVSGSASPGLYTFTALTSSPLAYAKNDSFTLDITSGSSTWKATIVAS